MSRRLIAAIATAIAVLFAATLIMFTGGCSDTPDTYAPAAYGTQVGTGFDCYYVSSPDEVTTLIARGYCPAAAIPTRMPDSWLDEYFFYYDSPAYYDTYVPVTYRTTYVTTYHTYYVQHTQVINTASKSATWKSSTGKTVSGTKVDTAKMKFSTGSGSGSTMGGGSLRGAPSTSAAKAPASASKSAALPSAGSSSHKSSTSVGGGSLRGRK